MSISDVHPHDARMSELKLLVVTILLGLSLIALILWLGMGQPAPSKIPGVSYGEVIQWNIKEIHPFFIPLAITAAVGITAMVTNSTLYEHGLNATGFSPGETGFIAIGTWMGATLALSLILGGQRTHTTPQELVCFLSGLMTILFGLLVVMTRNYR